MFQYVLSDGRRPPPKYDGMQAAYDRLFQRPSALLNSFIVSGENIRFSEDSCSRQHVQCPKANGPVGRFFLNGNVNKYKEIHSGVCIS